MEPPPADAGTREAEAAYAERVRAAERHATGIRLAIIGFAVLVYATMVDPADARPGAAALVAGAALAYTAALLVARRRGSASFLHGPATVIGADALLITAAVYATGGAHSPLHLVYFVGVVSVAFRYGARETVVATVAFAVSYAALLARGETAAGMAVTVPRLGFLLLTGLMAALLAGDASAQARARRRLDDEVRRQQRALESGAAEVAALEHREAAYRFHNLVLESLAEASGDGVLVFDADGRVLHANARFNELWGLPADAPGTLDGLRRHAEGLAADAKALRATDPLLDAGSSAIVSDEVLLADGRTLERYSAPLRAPDGAAYGRVIFFRDITLRKRAAEAQDLLSGIVTASHDAIVAESIDGTILSWNAGAARLYGYTAEEAIGRHFSFLVPPERADEVARILAGVRSGEPLRDLETQRVRKDGSRVHVAISQSPLRDATGRVIGSAAIARDVTLRKEAEAERERYLKELQRLNEELDSFTYTAGHDLAEPLRTMSAFSELVLREHRASLPAQAVEDLERVVRAARRMQALLEDLGAVARVGRSAWQPVATTLGEVMQDVLEDLHGAVDEAKGRVVVETPDAPLHGDRPQLLQLCGNLVANGLRHNEAAAPEVRVRADATPTGVRVSFTDNGVGIPRDERERVFGLFSRGSGARGTGTGTGLAIVKRIVERHGGRVWAEAAPGGGSVIVVELPRPSGPTEQRADA